MRSLLVPASLALCATACASNPAPKGVGVEPIANHQEETAQDLSLTDRFAEMSYGIRAASLGLVEGCDFRVDIDRRPDSQSAIGVSTTALLTYEASGCLNPSEVFLPRQNEQDDFVPKDEVFAHISATVRALVAPHIRPIVEEFGKDTCFSLSLNNTDGAIPVVNVKVLYECKVQTRAPKTNTI